MSMKSLFRREDCYKSNQLKIKITFFFFCFFFFFFVFFVVFFIPDKMDLLNALLFKQIFFTMKLINIQCLKGSFLLIECQF